MYNVLNLKIISLSFVLLVYVIVIDNSYALETDYSIGAAFRYTDNSLLTNNNKSDELSLITVLDLSLSDVTPKFNYSLKPRILKVNYTKKTLTDKTYYGLVADLNWNIIPSSFIWRFNNDLSVQDIEQTGSNVPDNKQQVNIFSTGPSVRVNFSSINVLLLDYTYSRIKNEVTNTDSDREFYSVVFVHDISLKSNISLNYEEEKVMYEDTIVNDDVSIESVFFEFDSTKARSNYIIAYGQNTVRDISSDRSLKGDLIRLSWDYNINYTSDFLASYRKELSDATNDINISNQENSGVSNTASLTNTNVYETERFSLSYSRNSSTDLSIVSLYGETQDYEISTSNQSTVGANVSIEHNLTNSFSITGYVGYVSTKVNPASEEKYDDTIVSFGTIYRLSNNIELIGLYTNNNRDSTIIGNSYEENVLFVNFVYSGGNAREDRRERRYRIRQRRSR